MCTFHQRICFVSMNFRDEVLKNLIRMCIKDAHHSQHKNLCIVQRETDAHESPVTDVLVCCQISLKDQAHSHGVSAVARGVDRSAESVLKLEFMCLPLHEV